MNVSDEEDSHPFEDDPTDEDSHCTGDFEDDEDEERSEIQGELSTMPFSELMKLKEELGIKVFQEAAFGATPSKCSGSKGRGSKSQATESNLKRLNKNRPREQSAKKQVPFIGMQPHTKKIAKTQVRDPRFDKNIGDYDPNKFKENYKFLREVRNKEIAELQEKLTYTTDERERTNIKFVMLRLRNKNIEADRWELKQDILKNEKKDIQKAKSEGKQPHYATKKECRTKELVKKYNELKATGKLDKHLEKKRKKNAAKDRKKIQLD